MMNPPPGSPATSDRHYSEEEWAFIKAVTEYQKKTGRRFMTISEYWHIAVQMGCREVAEPTSSSGASSGA